MDSLSCVGVLICFDGRQLWIRPENWIYMPLMVLDMSRKMVSHICSGSGCVKKIGFIGTIYLSKIRVHDITNR